ncbi:hypothetical protein [Azospirillum sp. sgz302134]
MVDANSFASAASRLTATFVRQVWIGDNAHELGRDIIDVTDKVLRLTAADIKALPASPDNDHLAEDTDVGRSHDGPFEVEVDEADLCDFFGIRCLEDLTDATVAARRTAVAAAATRTARSIDIEQLLKDVAGRQGWNEASQIAVLTDFLDDLVVVGKISTGDFADWLDEIVAEENGEAAGVDIAAITREALAGRRVPSAAPTGAEPAAPAADPIQALIEEFGGERGVWGEHPDYPRSDWRCEVANDDTNLGYWPWVAHEIEVKESEAEEGDDVCRTCGGRGAAGGDSYDGECPSCADRTAEDRDFATERA